MVVVSAEASFSAYAAVGVAVVDAWAKGDALVRIVVALSPSWSWSWSWSWATIHGSARIGQI